MRDFFIYIAHYLTFAQFKRSHYDLAKRITRH